MYENKKQPLLPRKKFYKRVGNNLLCAFLAVIVCLAIGVVGYKYFIPQFDWYDSLLNAAMILGGMGPMIDSSIQLSHGAKIFASCYALFSGVAFISIISFTIAPVVHRFLHKIHLDNNG